VASPVDVLPIERAGFFRGRYFVLGGLLSPLDGVRAQDLPFGRLLERLPDGPVTEMIIALDASVEGETTALYIQRLLSDSPLQLSRLATGIPVGGALAYTDEVTLQRAFQFRRAF
jgi:recombination protein RecR